MWSFALISAALLLSKVSLASVALVPRAAGEVCEGQVTLSETYIGQDKNVHVQFATCPKYEAKVKTLEARQVVDVCGDPCTTSCFTPSGGGPVPNDCHIIADALRFDSQNIGKYHFTLTKPYLRIRFRLMRLAQGTNNTVVVQFASCLSFFVNQDTVPIEYCRTDWASLIDFIAPNCQSTQNAHGGLCIATNQQWFAQVNHS
ncbi:hypothetical protein B0H13DRAFT_2662491 [Mycena leptocephala]|nr:hypothetical protein B0H13DRAFT_2662491 [Mycena leptocephala]